MLSGTEGVGGEERFLEPGNFQKVKKSILTKRKFVAPYDVPHVLWRLGNISKSTPGECQNHKTKV